MSILILVIVAPQWLALLLHSNMFVLNQFFFFNLNSVSAALFFCLQFVANMEQGLPLFPEWLCFNRISSRARQGFELGPITFMLRYDTNVDMVALKCILHLQGS